MVSALLYESDLYLSDDLVEAIVDKVWMDLELLSAWFSAQVYDLWILIWVNHGSFCVSRLSRKPIQKVMEKLTWKSGKNM